MSNQIFHFSNAGVSSGQRFYLKDDVSGIFVRNLKIDSNFPVAASNLVIQDNLLQSSQASGYLTGVGYSGNYDGGYFLGRTKLSQNTSRLVDSSFGNTWVARESNRLWRSISISSDGKYQTAVVGPGGFPNGGQIYVSSDYGNSWVAKESVRAWNGVSISSDGKYQSATVSGGQIYVSSDYGNTWVAKESSRNWFGISISSDGKYQSATAQSGQIYVSSDYGNSWVAKDSNRGWFGISISSDGKYQSATVSAGQIYVSSDYGNTWVAKDSNRIWRFISISSDGKYQTAVVNGGQIYVSSDYGNTWIARDSTRNWYGTSISSDGKYQAAFVNAGQIYVSSNYGNTWAPKDTNRNWLAVSISSDGKYISAVTYSTQIYTSKTDELVDGNFYADNLVYNTGNQTISGEKIFETRPTVNGTGVLLSGQNSFVINFQHAPWSSANNTNVYFSNINFSSFTPNTVADRRKIKIMQPCTAKYASWAHFTTTKPTSAMGSTGYFVNITSGISGIINTSIYNNTSSILDVYSGEINPPVPVRFGDEVSCGWNIPNWGAPTNAVNSVEVYFFN